MNPIAYFQYRYYKRWLGGITAYFLPQGYMFEDEPEQKTTEYLDRPELPLPAGGDTEIDEQVIRYLKEGDSPRRGSARPTRRAARIARHRRPTGDRSSRPALATH
jgi:nitrile hydratase subunit beta